MHRGELTNEQLQAEIERERKILSDSGGFGTVTRHKMRMFTDLLQELLDRRVDAESEFRLVEATMAYDSAASVIDGCVMLAVAEETIDWYDLDEFADTARPHLLDAVAYLNQRGLLDRHSDHPTWISVRDEDEPCADAAGNPVPLDPAPEVK